MRGKIKQATTSRLSILTGDADVGFAALGGPCGAPGHTLTPEVLRPKQLLHLLPSDLYAGFSHYQACKGRQEGLKRREKEKAHRGMERARIWKEKEGH